MVRRRGRLFIHTCLKSGKLKHNLTDELDGMDFHPEGSSIQTIDFARCNSIQIVGVCNPKCERENEVKQRLVEHERVMKSGGGSRKRMNLKTSIYN